MSNCDNTFPDPGMVERDSSSTRLGIFQEWKEGQGRKEKGKEEKEVMK